MFLTETLVGGKGRTNVFAVFIRDSESIFPTLTIHAR